MKKSIQFIIVTVLLVVCSGCFPVFIPEEGGKHGGRHDEGRHRGDR